MNLNIKFFLFHFDSSHQIFFEYYARIYYLYCQIFLWFQNILDKIIDCNYHTNILLLSCCKQSKNSQFLSYVHYHHFLCFHYYYFSQRKNNLQNKFFCCLAVHNNYNYLHYYFLIFLHLYLYRYINNFLLEDQIQ